MLDGFSRIPELVTRTKELGMPAIAITDHGTMYGALKFYKECKKQGVKPIIGCEVYLASRTMNDKEASEDSENFHLILLCKNETGYKNLIKIVSDAYTKGFYKKPRTDHEQLRLHSEGLICLSGCLAGRIQRYIVEDNYEKAKEEALLMKDIFSDDFYLELQNHHLDEDKPVINGLLRLSYETGIPYVVTNDSHYTNKKDAEAQRIAMCLAMKKTASDNYQGFGNDEFYLKSHDEMGKLFSKDIMSEAVRNLNIIADACNFDFELGNYHIPSFIPPAPFKTATEYFEHLCREGFKERYKGRTQKKELKDRLEMEINTIENMGYVEYFLIVSDFINYAKSKRIPVGPGRGSAAGSIVAYCLKITDLDPIKYALFFERFLNPERVSMPDIDVDFCIERREEVIEYVTRKYGADCVSRIITFNVLKPKSAIKDVARYYEMDYAKSDNLSKIIPDTIESIDEALNEPESELKYLYDNDIEVQTVVNMAKKMEGIPRHASAHAAGVIISGKPVSEYVPLYQSAKMPEPIAQFTMTEIEELGLLKMDFLGLRNLTVINQALAMIRENHGVDIDLSKLTLDDENVYKLLSKGNTVGVFQLEAKGITGFFKRLKPKRFEDIIAGVALYRPGPMDSIPKYLKNKNHPEKISYETPKLKPIYEMTYGCLVYQEQVMQVLMSLAGYSLGQADIIRRAMSKKKKAVMDEHREYFINGKRDKDGNVEILGCKANGISEKAANAIWDDMASFAQYAFNKSHAAAYSILTYYTAYLKAYYPAEFMAALMTSEANNSDHLKIFIEEAKRMRIKVLNPDVLSSKKEFTVKNGKILYGLDGIKNVGDELINAIVSVQDEMNNEQQPTIFSFTKKVFDASLNKRALENLISSSACDRLIENKKTGHHLVEFVLMQAKKEHRAKDQISMFDAGLIPDTAALGYKVYEEYSIDELLQLEKESLGFYVSKHPLDSYKKSMQEVSAISFEKLADIFDNGDEQEFVAAGIITRRKVITTKNGKKMAFIALEDFTGEQAVTIFSDLYSVKSHIFSREGKVVAIKAHASYSRGTGDVIVDDIVPIEQIYVFKEDKRSDIEKVVKLKLEDMSYFPDVNAIIEKYSGETRVLCYIDGEPKPRAMKIGISPNEFVLDKLKDCLGRNNVKYQVLTNTHGQARGVGNNP